MNRIPNLFWRKSLPRGSETTGVLSNSPATLPPATGPYPSTGADQALYNPTNDPTHNMLVQGTQPVGPTPTLAAPRNRAATCPTVGDSKSRIPTLPARRSSTASPRHARSPKLLPAGRGVLPRAGPVYATEVAGHAPTPGGQSTGSAGPQRATVDHRRCCGQGGVAGTPGECRYRPADA